MIYNNYLFPSSVVIEPTNVCNLRCIMCNAACSVSTNIKKAYMSPNQLDQVLNKLEGYIVNLIFQGDCEPVLNPYLPQLVKTASKYTGQISLVTNGTLLMEDLSRALVNNGLKIFSLSIDNHRDEHYNSIRIGAKLKDVLKNLGYLIKIRDHENQNISILVHKVVFPDDTLEDLKEFIYFFSHQYPVDKITFAPLIDNAAQTAVKGWVLLRNQLENELIHKGIYMNLRDYENYPYRTENKYYCGTNLFFINYKGDLKPCPLHSGTDKSFGNLFSDSLEDVANKNAFIEYHDFWLERRYDKKIPSICEDCYILKSPYFYYCLDEGVNAVNVFIRSKA